MTEDIEHLFAAADIELTVLDELLSSDSRRLDTDFFNTLRSTVLVLVAACGGSLVIHAVVLSLDRQRVA